MKSDGRKVVWEKDVDGLKGIVRETPSISTRTMPPYYVGNVYISGLDIVRVDGTDPEEAQAEVERWMQWWMDAVAIGDLEWTNTWCCPSHNTSVYVRVANGAIGHIDRDGRGYQATGLKSGLEPVDLGRHRGIKKAQSAVDEWLRMQ